MLLERAVPDGEEQRDADRGHALESGDHGERESAPDHGCLRGPHGDADRDDHHRAPRAPAQRDHAAGERPDPERDGNRRPRPRTAELPLGQHRSEDEDRRKNDDRVDREPGQADADPLLGADLAPPFEESREQRRHHRARRIPRPYRVRVHTGQAERTHREGPGVHRERASGAEHGDEHPGDGRADDHPAALHEASQRVGLLQAVARHELRQHALRRGHEEGVRAAEAGCEDGEVPDLGVAGEEQGRRDRLGDHPDDIASQHDAPPVVAVRDDPGEQR